MQFHVPSELHFACLLNVNELEGDEPSSLSALRGVPDSTDSTESLELCIFPSSSLMLLSSLQWSSSSSSLRFRFVDLFDESSNPAATNSWAIVSLVSGLSGELVESEADMIA